MKTLKEFPNELMSSCSEAAVMLEKQRQLPRSHTSQIKFSRNHSNSKSWLGSLPTNLGTKKRSLPTIFSLSDANCHETATDLCDVKQTDCNQLEKHIDKQSFY